MFFKFPSAVILVLSLLLSDACMGQNAKYRLSGDPQAVTSSKAVTGGVTGNSVQSAYQGKEFTLNVTGLPKNQTAQIELGFAALNEDGPGTSEFNLSVNGKPALQKFDIISEAAGNHKSIIKKFSITPPEGAIEFKFSALLGYASFNYIRVQSGNINMLIAPPVSESQQALKANASSDSLFRPDQQAPLDVSGATIHLDGSTQTWTGGVPLGGIGTGKFEILPNGQFANFTTNNSWDLPVIRPPGTFLAIAAKAISGGGAARMLQVNPTDSEGKPVYPDLPLMKSVDYKGNFPVATWEFTDEKIPLEFTVQSWSPLVPGNLDDSSLPAGLINVVITNPKNYPISTAVALSWEDLNGRGGSLLPSDQHGVSAFTTHQDATTSNITGIQISSDASNSNRDSTFCGSYFVGTPIKGAVISRKLSWNPRTGSIPWWKQFGSKLRLDRIPAAPASVNNENKNGPTASTLCVSFNLAPKESRRIPFVVSWYFPRIVTMDAAKGAPSVESPDYVDRFASAAEIASYVSANRVAMRRGTDEWTDLLDRASLPEWIKTHTRNSLFSFKTNSVLLKNQRFAMLESPSDMKGMLGPIDLRLPSQDFLLSLYPEQDKTELTLFATAQDASGRIPRYVGNIHGAIANFDKNLLGMDWYDPTATWILQIATHYTATGDKAFLDEMKPHLEKARDYLLAGERDGKLTTAKTVYSTLSGIGNDPFTNDISAAAALIATDKLLGSDSSQVLQPVKERVRSAIGKDVPAMALASELALIRTGNAPLFTEEETHSFLDSIIAKAFETKPVPRLLAGAESGKSIPLPLQYAVGALAYSVGNSIAGIEPFTRAFQIACAAQKNPWKLALVYDVPAAAQSEIRSHRSALSAWSLWQSLSGTVYDAPEQRLFLNPHLLDSTRSEMEIPVFTPAFWGWLKFNEAESTGTLSIIKVNPGFSASQITEIASGLDTEGHLQNAVKLPEPLLLEEGSTLKLSGWPRKPNGTVSIAENVVTTDADTQATGILSLMNETSTDTEQGVSDNITSGTTSRELEQGEEMPPTPEQDEPMPGKSNN